MEATWEYERDLKNAPNTLEAYLCHGRESTKGRQLNEWGVGLDPIVPRFE